MQVVTRRRASVASVFLLVASLTVGIAAPAGAATERYGVAEGLDADVTYKLTSLHVDYGPDPAARGGPAQENDTHGVVNLNVFAGFGSFEAESILADTSGNFADRVESSLVASNFNFLDFRGDQIVSECSASMTSATGTTTLTNVLADGGQPLADNPAPNTVLDFAPNFTVYLNEQHVTTVATGARIEVIGMRVVYLQAGDYSGEFSVGRTVCQFGAVGIGGGGPSDEDPGGTSDAPAPAVPAEPTFTG